MAVTTLQTLTTQQQTMTEIKEFLVPTILSVNLKKTNDDRLPVLETDSSSNHQNGEDVNISSSPSECDENEEKNFPNLIDHDNQINIEILDSGEDDEDVIEMAPRSNRSRGKHQSTFLLEPFLKPVDQNIEGNKENPVLKALYGGISSPAKHSSQSWGPGERTSINNCHPFKKTELSQDLSSDDIPTQIPKSLLKKAKKKPVSASPTRVCPVSPVGSARASVLKEIQLDAVQTSETQNSSTSSSSSQSFHSTKSSDGKSPSPSGQNNDSKSVSSGGGSSAKKKKNSQLSMKPRIGYINSERLIQLKGIVDNAIKNHKVYSMTGCYSSVRNALKQRGWIEKIDSDFKGRRRQSKLEEIDEAAFQFVQKNTTQAAMRYSSQCNSGFVNDDQITYSGQGEAEIINRMLRNITEDLCWLSRPYPYYCWKDIGKYDMVNRLPKAYFSNKVGLCNSLQQIQWFYEPGVCSTQYPRTYNISLKDEYEAFKDDFRITACICMLKWLVNNYKNGGEKIVRSTDGKVDVNIIEFALRRCAEFVKCKEHEDIDMPETPTIWEHQWDHFLTQYYKIINDGHILRDCKEDPPIQVIVTNAQSMLNLIKPHWPQMDIEGIHNYWIVKPGGRCCGNGIVIKNNLEQILTIVNPTITRETRYVVQKYIERPLLIYNTKFDIRQWFLVTNVYPLTIWMYKESYLRFCSQPFTLKNTHESVHLCNNAVQRRYKNPRRDRGLPDENMWDCYTFQTYLKAIGHPDAWDRYIYPGMKEGFIGALLASQDTMERRKNCFELYGADFMISDTLTDGPWLIEINSNPAMDSSTSVTARMCPQVLEDIVKVVIDRRDDKNASTGAFEMIFKQNCPPIPPYLGMSLSIKGKKVYRPSSDPKYANKKSKNNSSDTLADSDSDEESSAEENIVQKRCSTDFMQPIKTLIDTINGGFSPEDVKQEETDRANSSSAEETDSVHYDSDSDSDSDSEIALEGKEMELKKKSEKGKNKKKEEEKEEDAEAKRKEEINKRKKIDWIRKNIEDVKSFHSAKVHDKNNKNLRKKNNKNNNNNNSEKEKNKTVHEELESIFREEIIKMLDTIECKKFMEELTEPENKENSKEEFNETDLIETVWEPNEEIYKETEAEMTISKMICDTLTAIEDVKDDFNKIEDALCQEKEEMLNDYNEILEAVTTKPEVKEEEKIEPTDNNMSLLSISDFTDYELGENTDRTASIIQNEVMETGDSDFDAKFERELRELEVKQACLKKKFDKSKIESLSITPQGLLLRKKSRGIPRWNNTKTSMDYFREWKYKVDETRKTCEDMLAKLRVFKEANSKLKFHDALRKRMEDEAQFIKRLKVYRTTKNFVKMNKNLARKKVIRPQSDDEFVMEDKEKDCEPKSAPVVNQEDRSARILTLYKPGDVKYGRYFERHKKSKIDEESNRFIVKLQNYDLPVATSSDPPLAINSETGAVRNVSQTLPKIKQRNRPLLPNGSSGHGRKIEMALEKSLRKKPV